MLWLFFLLPQVLAVFGVYDDLFAAPKYVVKYGKERTLTEYETVKDHKHTCYIPAVSTVDDDQTKVFEEGINSRLNALSINITKELKDRLLFHNGGYWTYVFSHNGEIAQYRGEPAKYLNPETYKFILGKHNPKIDFPKLEARKADGVFYLTHSMSNGSICDVTGKPRITEIQYLCDITKSVPTLLQVKEIRTCQYQAQISLPSLCDDEFLKQREENFNEIVCEDEIDLMSYELNYIDNSLMLGEIEGQPSIIIDLNVNHEDFYKRLFKSFINWYPRYFNVQSDFKFHMKVYNFKNEYLHNAFIQLSHNELGQLMIQTDQSKDFDLVTNIELLNQKEEVKEVKEEEEEDEVKEEVNEGEVKEDEEDILQLLNKAIDDDSSGVIKVKYQRDQNGALNFDLHDEL